MKKGALFLSNWIEYHTHILNTQMLNFGVTEVEIIIAVIQFGAFLFGQQVWQVQNGSLLPAFLYDKLVSLDSRVINELLKAKLYYYVAYFILFMEVIIFIFGFVKTLLQIKTSKLEAVLQYLPFFQCVFIGKNKYMFFIDIFYKNEYLNSM